MEGYKIGFVGDIKVLITLLIPSDVKTNMNRIDIIDPTCAKYRCNRAYVIDIIDQNNIRYEIAESGFYSKKLIYQKGKITESEFNDDINIVNTYGIHYFLDIHMAINYKEPILHQIWSNEKNVYKDYYCNGQVHKKIKYYLDSDNKIIYKIIQEYYDNGQIKLDYNLDINKYDGLYREWYMNGIMKKRLTYEKNKVISHIERWTIHGIKC